MKYQRIYADVSKSIFLLGPRGSGKSTFIREVVKPDLSIDLLKSVDYRALNKNPSELEDMVAHLKPKAVVFIDEIQKIPELLDEVHRLIENKQLTFILTGSSARKLKKQGVNLLAGRALSRRMHPLSIKEIAEHRSLSEILFRGTLPNALNLKTRDEVNDFLFSYVETYLKEEILQEGIVRSLNEFSQFIELAGQYHGQIVNLENISREVGKSGDTIKSWFQILHDTLIGEYLEAYSLNVFPKESKHPKFYYFDPGVARAAEGIKNIDSFPEKNGFYFESLILNELKVYKEVTRADFKIFFYNVPTLGDIDFVIETKKKSLSSPSQIVTIDVKLSKTWNTNFEKLPKLIAEKAPKQLKKSVAIYLGDRRLTKNNIEVYPLADFISALWGGKIF
ncbi:MAG: AAA family ATPase [Bdellovibrionota bacterium]